jgi:hypothetical protein
MVEEEPEQEGRKVTGKQKYFNLLVKQPLNYKICKKIHKILKTVKN